MSLGCTAEETVQLTVALRTDYQPFHEFVAMRVLVDGEQIDELVPQSDTPYRNGVNIASVDGLPRSSVRTVEVILLDPRGDVLQHVRRRLPSLANTVQVMPVYRGCTSVVCGEEEVCLADGVCDLSACANDVSACQLSHEECVTDADCGTDLYCGTAVCDGGACSVAPGTDVCAAGEQCHIGEGCVPTAGAKCDSATDCVAVDECVQADCIENECTYHALPTGTTCSVGVCRRAECGPGTGCGDYNKEGAEACDDGNVANGDGCTSVCTIELGFACSGDTDCESGICDQLSDHVCEQESACGNGRLEAGEGCDDGNTDSGDGCTSACMVEDGAPCAASRYCVSGACSGEGVCLSMPGDCFDGVRSPGEEGIDCGGVCALACLDFDCAAQSMIPAGECEMLKTLWVVSGVSQASDMGRGGSPPAWFAGGSLNPANLDIESGHVTRINAGTGGALHLPWGLDVFEHLREFRHASAATGRVPTDIGRLNTLEDFMLTGELSGEVPNLSGAPLHTLIFRGRAAFPDWLATHATLQDASLFQVQGTLPATWTAPLTRFVVGSGILAGELPQELLNLTTLTELSITGMGVSGTLPTELNAPLDTLELSNNALSGPLPAAWATHPTLTELSLNGNQIDALPTTWSGVLESLRIAFNSLSGTLPAQLANLASLRSLHLSGQFFGSPPLFLNAMGGPLPAADYSRLNTFNLCGENNTFSATPQQSTALRTITGDWPAFGDSCP